MAEVKYIVSQKDVMNGNMAGVAHVDGEDEANDVIRFPSESVLSPGIAPSTSENEHLHNHSQAHNSSSHDKINHDQKHPQTEDEEVAALQPSIQMMHGSMDGSAGINGEVEANDVSELLSEDNLSPGINGVSPPPTSENDHLHNDSHAQLTTGNFAMEHRIFLRAILDLLTERDQLAIAPDVNGPIKIKTGSLRKASHSIGLWKTKYVEIRRGTFSYFDDNSKQRRSLIRKDIPLRVSSCMCRAVKMRSVKILPGNSSGAAFELRIQGGTRRLWMANSPEECQDWIQAIHNAMIGASVTRGDNSLECQVEHGDSFGGKNKNEIPLNSPYKSSFGQYTTFRAAAHCAQSKDEYLGALSYLRGLTITVPVQWIKSQLVGTPAASSFSEAGISSSVEQLWKDLLRDSVEINGEVLGGENFHGPDRIIGKLTQQILSSDAFLQGNCKSDCKKDRITEVQAILYARDILLASDRTRSGGDSYFCAENLCLNRNLVVLVPASTEANPISIKVILPQERDLDINDIIGWASARSSLDEPWKRQYLVLSHCVLSCYAEAEPKPHGLLEHIMLEGAKVGNLFLGQTETDATSPLPNSSVAENTVNIETKDGRSVREYLFDDEFDLLYWHALISKAAVSMGEGEKINSTKSSSNLHNPSTTACLETTPSVDVVINVCTDYKLCTLDPSGIDSEDTWATLRTTFEQKLYLTGGPNGRISRGGEVVELEMLSP